jgi:ribosomal protein S12 methylthiotransferase
MAKKNKQRITTVGFIALGCPKNMVDSERMLAEIAQAGLTITADTENADVVVINTCGFIAPAKTEAIETIKHVVNCKRKGTVKKVIAAGCLSERMGKDLFNEVDGLDAIVGLGQRDEIARIIQKTISSREKASYLEHSCHAVNDDRARLLIGPSHSAYLRISEGCDHKCSFCTIPAIRGHFRSKPLEMILAEAAELAEAGVVELNIIAQDTSYYGRDLKIKDGLATLLVELGKIAGPQWLRLMYLYPVGFTEKLIETITVSKKIVHYLDIPLQHINNEILKAMRRPDSKEDICRLIENFKKIMPDVVLRTTLIVGFPGETDEQFEELVEFVKWVRFDALGAFKYYAESGTDAAEMAGQIPEEIKEKRLDKLMLTQQEIAFSKNKERIGGEIVCLVDSVDKYRIGRGRFYGQSPEIDSVCIIENCLAKPGDFIEVEVVGTKDYDLIVRQI